MTKDIKKRGREFWSADEIGIIRDGYSGGNPVALPILSTRLRRTKAAVALKASRMGISYPRGKSPVSESARSSMSKAQKKLAETPERRAKLYSQIRQFHDNNDHPRGMLGKRHTPDYIKKCSERAKRMWSDPDHKLNSKAHRQRLSDIFSKLAAGRSAQNAFSRARYGKRPDLGSIFFRSAWEANYARHLNLLVQTGKIKSWKYEPRVFRFQPIKTGCRSYRPDFEVATNDGRIEYHEVKGWMYPRAKTALKQMAMYYPEITVVLIDETHYKALSKSNKQLLPYWE